VKCDDESQELSNLEKLKKKIAENKLKKSKPAKQEEKHVLEVQEIVESSKEDVEMESEVEEKSENEESNQNIEDEENPFTILGEQEFQEVQAIEMVLPFWLSNPSIISSDLTTPGTAINSLKYLNETLKKNLKSMKITNLFPVQEELIPWIFDMHKKPAPFRPRDVCVSAVTGSGKTLCYALPITQYISENRVECKVRALIMLPVYELAKQVFDVFDKLCNNLKVRPILLSKNRNFEMEQKMLLSEDGASRVDIIVSTGGRLVEHLFFTKNFDLKNLKFLVIDEADHAMAQIHNDWYHHYIQHIGVKNELQSNRLSFHDLMKSLKENGEFIIPQKLLLSATLSQDPEKINVFNLFQPKLFSTSDNKEDLIMYQQRKLMEEKRGTFVGKYTTPAELSELFCITEYKLKPLTLFGLIKTNNWKRFLCFTNSIESSHRLSFVLQTLLGKDLIIEELSSLLPIKVRQKVLTKFSSGQVNGIICTDALARGIDVPNVDAVISYDLPKHLKVYIHRIGRTARAGQKGTALTIIAPDQIKTMEKLLETAGKKLVKEYKPDRIFEENNALVYANALKKLQEALEMEEKERKRIKSKTSGGISLFEKLQRQVKKPSIAFEELPETWRPENIQQAEEEMITEPEIKKKNLAKNVKHVKNNRKFKKK
jgi:ATP-dependent RNA helicase DDX51/DBP6